jgi:hypothetical protein
MAGKFGVRLKRHQFVRNPATVASPTSSRTASAFRSTIIVISQPPKQQLRAQAARDKKIPGGTRHKWGVNESAGSGENIIHQKIETWPQAPRKRCGCLSLWRRCEEHFVEDSQGGEYMCVACKAREPAASARIKEEKQHFLEREEQSNKIQQLDMDNIHDISGISRRESKVLANSKVSEVMVPLVKFLDRKREVLQLREEHMKQHQGLLKQLHLSKNIDDTKPIMEQLGALEYAIEIASRPLAFSSKGHDQYELINAADCDDSWVEVFDVEDNLKLAMNIFYICMAGVEGKQCSIVIHSKQRERKRTG